MRPFEWKQTGIGVATPLLYNDILGILQDAAKCIWLDAWQMGASPLVEYLLWGSYPVRTQITCKDGSATTTKAGTYENCLKRCLDITGLTDGFEGYG